jgi:hypothetical protein
MCPDFRSKSTIEAPIELIERAWRLPLKLADVTLKAIDGSRRNSHGSTMASVDRLGHADCKDGSNGNAE